MTYEELCDVNKMLDTINIKGKPYVTVSSKVQGFRKLYPNGAIETELLSMENGTVTIKAKAFDEDGHLLGCGIAQEKESSSFINQTSYVENCETSAIGRCLSAVGIGSQDSYASAAEMENAINNQGNYATDSQKKELALLCVKKKKDLAKILQEIGFEEGNKLTVAQLEMAVKLANED